MENRKTTLDREPISSEGIRGRQNFNQVLKGHLAMKPPLWKSVWFYGPVGLATIALVVAVSNMKPNVEENNQELNAIDVQKEQVHEAKNQLFSETNSTVVSKKDKVIESALSDPPPPEIVDPTIEVIPEIEDPIIEDPVIATIPVVKVNKTHRMKTMPNIAGVFTGKLNIDDLCEAGGVSCNNDFTVYSYDIQYYNGYGDVIERIRGDKFPPFLCNKLRLYNLNQEVMITNILAKNEEGFVERLISMRIEPTF